MQCQPQTCGATKNTSVFIPRGVRWGAQVPPWDLASLPARAGGKEGSLGKPLSPLLEGELVGKGTTQ